MTLTILDGRMMTDRDTAHDYLAEALSLPDYYGHNLDALFDCLTERTPDDFILIEHAASVPAYLSEYGERLLEVFREACAEGGPSVFMT